MELQSVWTVIEGLFSDLSAFARLAAGLSPEQYRSKLFDCFDYPLGLFWLGIPKVQISVLEEAFAALFLLYLHHQEEWIYTESARTTSEQFVIDRPPEGEWARLLQDIWIPQVFGLSRRRPRVTPADGFPQSLLRWMPETAGGEERAALEDILRSTRWVCSLFPGDFYDLYFGQTEKYYFLAESGVYD